MTQERAHPKHAEPGLARAVPALLGRSPHVKSIALTGSRSRGTAGPRSDWDFLVHTDDFGALRSELSGLVAPLAPIVEQWDRLSDRRVYMLVLPGAIKVDLIFDGIGHRPEPPWRVAVSTLQGIDEHFWDWTLWLWSKARASQDDLVRRELSKLHEHILAPMGVVSPPRSLRDAVTRYRAARGRWETTAGVRLDRRLEHEVMRRLSATI